MHRYILAAWGNVLTHSNKFITRDNNFTSLKI